VSAATQQVTAGLAGMDASDRARAFAEAPGCLAPLRGSVVVVKYGGAAMTAPELADSWARDVVLLHRAGVRTVVVHGGGPALTSMLARMGIDSSFQGGHRVTSAAAAEVAEMVLSGRINKEVVSRLVRAGGRAVGLSGTDAGMVRVRRHRPGGQDIGFVGEVESLDPAVLRLLLDHGYVPVLSSTAADAAGQPFNINADLVAGAVAATLGAARLVFLSDVEGFKDDAGSLVPVLGTSSARRALQGGTATGGMRPKLQGALAALAHGVGRVQLADGTRPHALLLAILGGAEFGTAVVSDATERSDA